MFIFDPEMKKARHQKEIDDLLATGKVLSTEDFMQACPNMAKPSVYSRIRSLVLSGQLTRVGKGRFLPVHKPPYPHSVTPWMLEVSHTLHESCVEVNYCMSQKGNNLYIDATKSDIPLLEASLKQDFPKVAREKDAKPLLDTLEGYIIIGSLVSDAPIVTEHGAPVSSIEKEIVDYIAEQSNPTPEVVHPFLQRIMEVHPVNMSTLKRYAARRGVSDELSHCLDTLDNGRIEMFTTVQQFFAGTSITKAWVFGSFARGEETPESDLDLLVDYDKDAQVSLLDLVRYKLDLEASIHREVDLIPNGSLKPFAVESANRDKYLIYER